MSRVKISKVKNNKINQNFNEYKNILSGLSGDKNCGQ